MVYIKIIIYKILSIFSKRKSFSTLVINSKLDKYSVLRPKCRVYNSSLGKYSYIGRDSLIQNTTIGAFCSISERCNIGMPSHPLNYLSTSPVFLKGKNCFSVNIQEIDYEDCPQTNIGNDVWIGANVLIKSGVTIGNGAVIGAGAVVTHNVPDYAIVAGIPARIIRYRFNNETKERLLRDKWWNLNDKEIQQYIIKNNLGKIKES